MFDLLAQDIRDAVRTLRRRPGFAAAVILTLGLGIGANTGVFSLVYGILFRPLPYKDAERLVLVEAERDISGTRAPARTYFPLADLEIFETRSPSFESVSFYATDEGVVSHDGATHPVEFATVSTSFFTTMDGKIRLGGPLGPSDDLTPSIVISERLWRGVFNGSADIIGQRVVLQSRRGDGSQREAWRREPFTIVGVAAATFQFPRAETDVWTSAAFVRTLSPRCCSFLAVARLKQGATLSRANSDAIALARLLATTRARDYAGVRARAVLLHEHVVGALRPLLLILLAAVGLVLGVACANVMNLLLARNTARAGEMAFRRALGASRRRLLVRSLVETGLLATLGAAVGIGMAAAMVAVLRWMEPANVPRLDDVHVDLPVLLFACAATALTTLVTGLLPALQSDVLGFVRMGGIGVRTRPSGARVRRALLVAELAVSVVLLVGAMLLGRSLLRLIHTDVGVETSRAVTASMSLGLDRELNSAQQIALVDRLLEHVGRSPGISAVGIGTSLPPRESRILLTLRGADAIDYQATAIPATPGYFPALGMRLRKGRFFTNADAGDAQPVMIMTADTARHFFGDADPLGRTLSLPVMRDGTTKQGTITLVGIIGDVKYSGLDRAPDDAIYRPFAQQPWPNVFLVARTEGNPASLVLTLRRQIADVDRAIAVTAVNTLDNVISEAAAQPRLRMVLLAGLAGLSLALATTGLYGVVSYSVMQRRTEIGIRMAIGATNGDVLRMILGEGLWLAVGGVAIGIGVAYGLSRTIATLLYGIERTDAASFAGASVFLLLFALIASYLLARRATGIDPAVALRAE